MLICFQVVLITKFYVISRNEDMHKVSLCTTATEEVIGVQNTHCMVGENTRSAISSLEDIPGMIVTWLEFAFPQRSQGRL